MSTLPLLGQISAEAHALRVDKMNKLYTNPVVRRRSRIDGQRVAKEMNFLLKIFVDRLDSVAFAETNYVNTEKSKFESSYSPESGAQLGMILRKLAANLSS